MSGGNQTSATSRGLARVYGSAGERPRLDGLARAAWPVLASALGAGYLLRALFPQPALTVSHIGLLFLGLGLFLALALAYSRTRLAAFVKGARGEERVARELGLLPAGFTVYNGLAGRARDALAAAADYDHVVVGPTGVFVIETKNWQGRVTVQDGAVLCDGRAPSRPPLDQVKAAVAALGAALREQARAAVPVQPVVCFAADSLEGGQGGAAGVRLANASCLNAVLQEPPEEAVGAEALGAANRYLQGLLDG